MGAACVYSSLCLICNAPKVTEFIRTTNFHKKHPNVNININIKEVEKTLEQYVQLSKIPKSIESQKEDHLTTHKESFREMTTEEKLAFLNQEKAFWEQVAIEEKYKDTGEDTTCQAEIGQVKISTEDKDKVYHI